MRITILCSSESHPVNSYLENWIKKQQDEIEVDMIRSPAEASGGDLLFLISCSDIISKLTRNKYRKTLVIHASDLPIGRGWSPHLWQVIEGCENITLSLLEAKDEVDTGDIWAKVSVQVPLHALWDEINQIIFNAEMYLMDVAVDKFSSIQPTPQDDTGNATYYRKRTPLDSKLDEHKSIAEQFNLMRICDPCRFPAYFEMHGHRYKLILEKIDEIRD